MIELLILVIAVTLDLLFGEPSSKIHPTVWIGKVIELIKVRLKDNNARIEKIKGSIAALTITAFVFLLSYFALEAIEILGTLALVIATSLMLKSVIAIRSMEEHARAVMDALANNDLELARRRLSMIVGRDTSNLDEQHILSATIESISESTVDGITAPLFYYALFGMPAAFAYRAINTLDSMLGYRDDYHKNIGYLSAKLDTIANFIPARVTAFLMIIAARITGEDWKDSMRIMLRDRRNTPSKNSGWTMSTTAGALRIRLEKIGFYTLGDEHERITLDHCERAIRMMKVTVLLFCIALLPLLVSGGLFE